MDLTAACSALDASSRASAAGDRREEARSGKVTGRQFLGSWLALAVRVDSLQARVRTLGLVHRFLGGAIPQLIVPSAVFLQTPPPSEAFFSQL